MKYEVTFWRRNAYAIADSPEEFEVIGNSDIEAEEECGALAIAVGEAARRWGSENIAIEIAGNIFEL